MNVEGYQQMKRSLSILCLAGVLLLIPVMQAVLAQPQGQITSPRDAATALVNSQVLSGLIDQNFWQGYFAQADKLPEPPAPPFHSLREYVAALDIRPEEMEQRMNAVLKVETGHFDTHPSLSDRLAALGEKAQLPAPITHSAAAAWLDPALDDIIADFDAQ